MAAGMVARTGRQNQVYHNGCRLIAGCIPYRFNNQKILEVLVVKAQKSDSVLFPKGGWENDETLKEAAVREAMEEAGVEGILGEMIGVWTFSSKGHAAVDHIAHMFPLKSPKLRDCWPEMHRERIWMPAEEARTRVKHQWMTEALDKLMSDMGLGVDNGYRPVIDGQHAPGMPMKPSPNKASRKKQGRAFLDKRKMAEQNHQKQMTLYSMDRFFLSSVYTSKLGVANSLFSLTCFSI